LESTRRPSARTAAAVSSHELSIPRTSFDIPTVLCLFSGHAAPETRKAMKAGRRGRPGGHRLRARC
jgi:hypothetical protein